LKKIVEREVYNEKIIPTTVEVVVHHELDVDATLQSSYDGCRVEYQLLGDAHARLEEELHHLKHRYKDCHHVEDWTSKLSQIRRRCVELEIEISNCHARKHHKSGSTREKVTTVVYTESSEAMELKRQIAELTGKNRMINEKIGFHQSRIGYGSKNYSHSVVHNDGVEVRQLRKSNRNKQNNNAWVGESTVQYTSSSRVVEEHSNENVYSHSDAHRVVSNVETSHH